MAYQPKSYRKFLAGTVSAAVVASAIAPVASASFTDVTADNVHAGDINTLVEKGYIKGYPDGTFKPKNSLTRGEAAIIFSRILKDAGVTQKGAGFPDVPASKAELAEAVAIVQAAGIMTGDEKGNFNPNANITREQMAKVVVEAFKLTKPANYTTKVTDLDKAAPWAREYIQVLEANGVTKNTEFMPKQNVTRGQFASFVVRAMNVGVTAAHITGVTFVDLNTLEVTFNGELKEVKKEDFAIQGVEIESVSIKAAAAAEAKTTVVVIKTKTALEEGKSYSVSYKGQTTDKAKVDVPVVTPKVESVSAINAKEVQIKFNKAIKKDTIIESNGTLVDGVITFNSVEGATAVNANASTAVLSEDGKTLTVTANTTFNGKYVVSLAADKVKTADGTKFVEKYTSEILIFKDEVRPTLLGVSYPSNGVATFTFSEPLNVADAAAIEAALEIRDANGNVVSDTGLVTLASDKKSFDLNISSFTVDKNYTVTLAGLSDFAGNLITPNPISTTVVNKVLDNVAPTVEKVEAVKTGVLKVTLSEKVKVPAGNVIGTYNVNGTGATNIVLGAGGNATLDSTGKVITITDPTNFTGIKTITLDGFKDLSGNTLASPVSKVLEFKADTTKPAYVSHEVKEISGGQYLIVKYNEEITADNSVGALSYTYVDSNQVTQSGSITNNATNVVAYDTDGDSVNDALKISLAGLNAGNYTLSLPAGLAKDTATPTANTSDAKTVTFTLGTLNDTGKPTIVDTDSNPANGYSGITVQSTEDYVTVVFSENVSPATALNVANYTVEGQQVFESAILDGNQYTVKLKLKPNVITVTGLRNFTIQNVTDVAGNVMNPVTTQVTFKENVKPVVTGASLIAADTIKVTFSEDMLEANLEDATPDFKVLVDGAEKTVSGLTYDAATKSLNITFTSAVTDLSKPISLEVLSGNNVVDTTTPANKLATTGTIVVSK
ncbi:S-layer homology domain-containing protein [Anoxybacillus flavithermus]